MKKIKNFPSGVSFDTDEIKIINYREKFSGQVCVYAKLKSDDDEIYLAILDSVDDAKKYIAELTNELNHTKKDEIRCETIFDITLDDRTKTLRTTNPTNGGGITVHFDKIAAFFVAGTDDIKIRLLCDGGVIVDICEFKSVWSAINDNNAKKVVEMLQRFLHFKEFAAGNICLNSKYKFEFDVSIPLAKLDKYVVVCRHKNVSIPIASFNKLADASERRQELEGKNETCRN